MNRVLKIVCFIRNILLCIILLNSTFFTNSSSARYYGYPGVFAGFDQEFNLATPRRVILTGKVPENATGISWSQIEGPSATLLSPTNSVSEVVNLGVGWSIFQLTATYTNSAGVSVTERSRVKVIVHATEYEYSGVSIMPYPKYIEKLNGKLQLTLNTKIVFEDELLRPLGNVLANEILLMTGLQLRVVAAPITSPGQNIALKTDSSMGSDEEYRLTVNSNGILVEGKTYRALAWGTTSLVQSIQQDLSVPWMGVRDQPTAGYRGLLIDVARNYHPIAYMKELIIMCRLYKINYLQLHLNDKEGTAFPFSAPELHNVPSSFTVWTMDEVKDLVAFADARGVTLVPELSGPGHHAGNIRLLYGRAGASAIDIANENTYIGMDKLITEISEVFKSSPYIHIGGDEADLSGLGRSDEEKAYIAQHHVTDLLSHYIGRMNEIIKTKGKKTIVWEGFGGDGDGLSRDIIVMPYESLYNPPDSLASYGFNLINTAWKPLYVVGYHNWTPSYLFNSWNMWLWEHHIYSTHIQLERTAPVMGAQMCAWEQSAKSELASLRYRLSSMSERIWNPDSTQNEISFDIRNMRNNAILNSLLGYPKIQSAGVREYYNGFELFNAPVEVRLSSPNLGKIRYTLDGTDPTVTSPIYASPINIHRDLTNGVNILYERRKGSFLTAAAIVTLKTRIYAEDGKPRSELASTNNYWFKDPQREPGLVPVVNAGPDQSVSEETFIIQGKVGDDDLVQNPIPSQFSATWTQVAGAPLNFTKISGSDRFTFPIRITNLQPGDYAFQLEARDKDGNRSMDMMKLNVYMNDRPVVSAGPDQGIILPNNSVMLSGSATDNEGIASVAWQEKAGKPVLFGSPNSLRTTVGDLKKGAYTFVLKATDPRGKIGEDSVLVVVNDVNKPPQVSAGPDQNVSGAGTLRVTLSGKAIDLESGVRSTVWSMVSGNTPATIDRPNDLVTTASISTAGTYIFKLTVTDQAGLVSTDAMKIIVTRPTPPPTASFQFGRLVQRLLSSLALVANAYANDGASLPPLTSLPVSNLENGATVAHSLPLLKGTLEGEPDGQITVTNQKGELTTWPVFKSRFKVLVKLVPGANQLKFKTATHEYSFNLNFVQPSNIKKMRVFYFLGSDQTGELDAPPGVPNGLDEAIKRIKLSSLMIQTFFVESYKKSRDAANGTTTSPREMFHFALDSNGDPKVHVIHHPRTRNELAALGRNVIYSEACFYANSKSRFINTLPIEERWEPTDAKRMIWTGIAHVDPETGVYNQAGTAHGGSSCATMHTGNLIAHAPTLEDVDSYFFNTNRIETQYIVNDSYGRSNYWGSYTTTLGAMVHELGHGFKLPHVRVGVMASDASLNINRFFSVYVVPRPGEKYPIHDNNEIRNNEPQWQWWNPSDISILQMAVNFIY